MAVKDKKLIVKIEVNTLLNIVLIGLAVVALFHMRELVFVVMISIVLASFIRTAATSFKRRFSFGRSFSIVAIYVMTLAVFSAIFYFFIPVLLRELATLVPVILQYIPEGVPALGNFSLSGLNNAGDLAVNLGAQAQNLGITENLSSVVGVVSNGFASTLSAFFGGLVNVILIVVISFYLSVSRDGIESFLRIMAPAHKEAYIINLWKRSQRKIALWMQGQMILGVVVGFLTFLGLALLQVEYAVLLAVVAAVFELIPFGIFLAAIPAISLAFTTGGFSLAVIVIILYIVIQQLESYFIAPYVQNKVIGVSPLIVILSVLMGVSLAGFWGLILAVPVAVTLLEYVKDLEEQKTKHMNLGKKISKDDV